MAGAGRTDDAPVRRSRGEATRRAILAAFAEQFGRPGMTDVSVPEAAERVGASVRTVYHHFPTREDRLEALAEWAEEVMGPVGSVLDSVDDIPGHIRLAYARAERHPALTRAGMAAGFANDVRRRRLQPRREHFRRLVDEVGVPPDVAERATAVLLVLATSEAGLPLVDSHGLSFTQAGEAAAEAAASIIRGLREDAARSAR